MGINKDYNITYFLCSIGSLVINELARDGNRSTLVLILISKQGKAIQLINTCLLSQYANYKFKLAGMLHV